MPRYCLSAFADEAAADLQGQMDACERNGFHHIEMRFVDARSIVDQDRKSTRLNSSHYSRSRMPSSA